MGRYKEILNLTLKLESYNNLSIVLMSGNSLYSDFKCGNDFGIDTCRFNIVDEAIVEKIIPTYEVNSLLDVLDIV